MKIADKLEGIMKEVAELEKQPDEFEMRDIIVKVEYFKKSGKWYTGQAIGIPYNLNQYERRGWLENFIKNDKDMREFNCVCIDENILGYPLFVPAYDAEEENNYEPIEF